MGFEPIGMGWLIAFLLAFMIWELKEEGIFEQLQVFRHAATETTVVLL